LQLPVNVGLANVGELVVPIDCGSVKVTAPVCGVPTVPLAKTWFAVPVMVSVPALGTAQVPSPRQNVVTLAAVPLFRLVTEGFQQRQ